MKTYKARLTQNGSDAPVALVFENSLGRNVNWTRTEPAHFTGEVDPPFNESAQVFCYSPVRDNSGDVTTGSATAFTIDGNHGGVSIVAYGEGEDGIIGYREIDGTIFVAFEVVG